MEIRVDEIVDRRQDAGLFERILPTEELCQAADFLALAKYKQVYLKITPINVTPKTWGKGTPETFFGKMIDTFGAPRIAWGSNFPNSVGTLSEILEAARRAFSFAKDSDREWIFGKTAQALYPALAGR